MATYACADLHGYIDLYQQIKDFIKPDDYVICLGDCGDRGPHSWKTITAVARDPQFLYLKGNHEDMLVGAMAEYLGMDEIANRIQADYPKADNMIQLCIYNGGFESLCGWVDEGMNPGWMKYLMSLPYMHKIINENGMEIHLSHAGYTPSVFLPHPERLCSDLLWDREHITKEWPFEDQFNNLMIIHGHTPCDVFDQWKPQDGAIWYADGHKINIDMGTYRTGYALLLNLDTFEEHMFKTKEKEFLEKE